MRSNVMGISRRGFGYFQSRAGTRLVRGYIFWALEAEPPNSPRRRELLLLLASIQAGNHGPKCRLRSCKACHRPYVGRKQAIRAQLGSLCPQCRHEALQTPLQLHRKAIRKAKEKKSIRTRVRIATGDPKPPPPPKICQHKVCDMPGKLTWLSPLHDPVVLCLQHRHEARKHIKLAKPLPVGRPRITSPQARKSPIPKSQ
jgi:hypothetical protein